MAPASVRAVDPPLLRAGLAGRAKGWVALWCALAAVGTCLAAALAEMSPNGFSPSKLVHLGDGEPLAATARATDPGFVLVPGTSHYDGVYYYAIGRDPLARGPEHLLIDAPAYRYGHAGFGWLAWITSA
ncbi:MAG: hypothetical protein QOE29_910, partial [Gaiellaceae bacterium]|nr:hypothetical protein [Gaiellaceae bacterium]